MKQIILAALAVMALTFGSAQATIISGDVGTTTHQYTRAFDVRVQEDKVGVQLSENAKVKRIEVDYNVIPLQAVKFVSVSVGVGEAIGTDTIGVRVVGHSTYSIEPQLTIPVSKVITLNAGYKFRNSLATAVRDETRTATVGASYKLTENVDVSVKFQRVQGDIRQSTASVGTSYSF